VVELAGDVALQAADDLSPGSALGCAAGDVGAGALVEPQPGQDDGVEGVVRRPVTAAVEPVAADLAAAGRDRRDPAQVRERRLRSHPIRVVPDGGQQLPGDLNADTEASEQAGCGGGDQAAKFGIGKADLGAQELIAAGQPAQR
jgi:general stress protein YciG